MGQNQRREAWRSFLEAHARVVAHLEEELEHGTGMPLSWYDVLAQLSAAPDHRLRLQDLGKSLVISKSGLTRRIDRMEEAGLVERVECREDRRGAFAVLTPFGEAALTEAMPVHMRGVEEHFLQYLSEEEAQVMASTLRRIVDVYSLTNCPGTAQQSSRCPIAAADTERDEEVLPGISR